ncbi:hypothetical protein [Weeksella virosa]|uniref:Uncharacterized protein n=1 Tax=Weeksella virosa (strain ATCC 43766 / DSM 16922 / JCM 21250 / CCUG 30538 / CDC 9751 / IAM 14551 / NBRC 16016 / NCTC 11634 / CL345/78) TaxID=865938 RepID=F0P2G8_WEEVC|nr:hypothetical protein [Weeksella virosa]ADX66780.1 hypothetical protein Weevi_0052 [Weeksella virosa DSM 16922]VEH63497.1 Uncharacterised protein [Weeksella virosa]
MKTFFRLFGDFWVFVFPLFFIDIPPFIETSPIMAMVYFVIGVVGWLVFIGIRFWKSIIVPRKMAGKVENMRRNGKKVEAKILEKKVISIQGDSTDEELEFLEEFNDKFSTKVSNGDQVLHLVFEFENHVGTKMTGSLELVDSKPSQKRFEKGNYLSLVLPVDSNADVPYYFADGEIVMKTPISTYLFIAFCLLYCVVSFVIEYHLYSNGRGLRFLHIFFPWVVSPYIGIFVYKTFDSVFSGRIFERLNSKTQNKLLLYGKKAIGDVTEVSQTGVYINEQPQMKFNVIYTDERGQTHQASFKQIVMLNDLHKTQTGKWELLYLRDEPKVIELLNPISNKENTINLDDFSKEELAELLNEIISKRKNKE